MKTFNWDEHYARGGQSGDPREYSASRVWKQGLLHKYFSEGVDTILDVGCGDLQFWNDYPPIKYTGIDISQTIIDKHRKNHPNQTFQCLNASQYAPLKADVVICFDLLWHITDDVEYLDILNNIKQYSDGYIYIFTWGKDPFTRGLKETVLDKFFKSIGKISMTTDGGGHQKYRDFSIYSKEIIEPEFELIETHTSEMWKYGTMYIYRKK